MSRNAKQGLLLDAGARLTVNALAFIPQFTAWADAGMLTLVEGPFDESLLDTCWLAIAATDDDALNQRVSEAAEARRIFCNVVDAPKAASFIMPSIIDRSPLMVAVSSGGTLRSGAPVARKTRITAAVTSGPGSEIRRAITRASKTAVRHDG